MPYRIAQSFGNAGQNKSVRKFPKGSFRTLFLSTSLRRQQAAVFEYRIAG